MSPYYAIFLCYAYHAQQKQNSQLSHTSYKISCQTERNTTAAKWLFICVSKLAKTGIRNTAHSKSIRWFPLINKTKGCLNFPFLFNIDYWLSIVKWVSFRRCDAAKGIGDCWFTIEPHRVGQFHHPSILTNQTLEAETLEKLTRWLWAGLRGSSMLVMGGSQLPVPKGPRPHSFSNLFSPICINISPQSCGWIPKIPSPIGKILGRWEVWRAEILEICPSKVFSQESPPSPWINRLTAMKLTN